MGTVNFLLSRTRIAFKKSGLVMKIIITLPYLYQLLTESQLLTERNNFQKIGMSLGEK